MWNYILSIFNLVLIFVGVDDFEKRLGSYVEIASFRILGRIRGNFG